MDSDIKTIGDLYDEIPPVTFLPFVNTVVLIIFLITSPILYLNYKFNIFDKFKDIKLRK